MVKVYKSDTGRFVLLHERSDTVVVDESLEEGYRKLEETANEKDPAFGNDVAQPEPSAGGTSSNDAWKRFGLLLILILLPFLWLAILHSSMGGLIDEYMIQRDRLLKEEGRFATIDDIRRLQVDVNRLAQQIEAGSVVENDSELDR